MKLFIINHTKNAVYDSETARAIICNDEEEAHTNMEKGGYKRDQYTVEEHDLDSPVVISVCGYDDTSCYAEPLHEDD